jgi:hypothetical protein
MTILLFLPRLWRVLKWDLLFNERRGFRYYGWVPSNGGEWLGHSLTTWPSPTYTDTSTQIKSKSHCDWGSVCLSWYRSPVGAHDQTFLLVWKLLPCPCGAPSLMRVRVDSNRFMHYTFIVSYQPPEAGVYKDGRSRQGRLVYMIHLDQQYRKHSYPLNTEDRYFLVRSTFSLLQKKGNKQSAVYSSAKCMLLANSPATEPRLQAERAINIPSESAYGLLRNAVLVTVS